MSPGMSLGVTFPRLRPRFDIEFGVMAPMGGKRGVDEADLVPPRRLPLRVLLIDGMDGAMEFWDIDRRLLPGACRLREERPEPLRSSLPGDAVRRLVPVELDPGCCCCCCCCCCWMLLDGPEPSEDPWFVLYAPSHGLVKGDISSKSRSA